MRIFVQALTIGAIRRAASPRRAVRRFLPGFAAPLLAAVLSCALVPAVFAAERSSRFKVTLLTRELGDPRAPGNVKLMLEFPDLGPSELARLSADDFRVYVHPAGLDGQEGVGEAYRTDGLYLWRTRTGLFLDARVVPVQDNEGRADIRVVYAPGGRPVAEAVAEGGLRYTSNLVDVMLAVDISRSMLYNDPKKLRVAAARTFMDMARQGGGIGRVGLVTFNHRAAKNAPLLPLEEGETVINALNRVGADGLTNIDRALNLAAGELEGSKNPVIILLTDGKNEGSPYRDTHKSVAEKGIRLFTVGLSEQADHKLLQDMAELSDGIYFRAVQDSDLPDIYARLAAELGKRRLLRAEPLRSAEGEMTLPIDPSVRRLVVMADGGARAGALKTGAEPGHLAGMFSDVMSSVLMGRPEPGEWNFIWDRAVPDVSTLALFGDTRFFLDSFPARIIGDKLYVGATLAEGAKPLPGATVYVEPVPGILPHRLELRDGGEGVYAGVVDLPGAPDRFDIVIRAEGETWNDGVRFVRQNGETAVRVPVPPPEAVARVGGDIDFGVLFPGETGTAEAAIELDSKISRDLSLDLSWDNADDEWRGLSALVRTPPGKHAYQLEIAVPPTAVPGEYRGAFSVSDGDEIHDTSHARVQVGTVTFTEPGIVDLGVVPPGTFVSREFSLAYSADKSAPLTCRVDGHGDLDVVSNSPDVTAGPGEAKLELTVSAPMDRQDGEYSGRVILAAGPGQVAIPVVWQVRPYAAAAPNIAPITGLPRPPELSGGARPLQRSRGLDKDLWQDQEPVHTVEPLDSPWEKSERIFNESARRSHDEAGPAGAGGFAFPDSGVTKKGGTSFWSAWWLYILAALLLLLLLLLLLAYLLYRLGKSHLARMLLASSIANIILLILFIVLLGTAGPVAPRDPPSITVTLVENTAPGEVRLSAAEQALLGGSSLDAPSGAGGGYSEIEPAGAAAARVERPAAERQASLPAESGGDKELVQTREATAMPLERREPAPMQRRDRTPERSVESANEPELAEMAEPRTAPEAVERRERMVVVNEARLELEASDSSERPVWSYGDRPAQPVPGGEEVFLAATIGAQKVGLERTAARVQPRGLQSAVRDRTGSNPEPRVAVADPARDVEPAAAPDHRDLRWDDPGVEEVRVAARSQVPDAMDERRGAVLSSGVSQLPSDLTAHGFSGDDTVSRSRPRGGPRRNSGRAVREGSAAPGPEMSGMPGGGAVNATAASSGGRRGGGPVGEQRFDSAGAGQEDGGAPGSARASAARSGGNGSGNAAPSPLSVNGDDGAGRAHYASSGDDSGNERNNGVLRGDQPRRGARDGSPQGDPRLPAGSVGPRGDNDGTPSRLGTRPGVGEGRFDGMAAVGDADARGNVIGGGVRGLGRSNLADDGSRDGLDVVSFGSDNSDWRRADRRAVRRTSASVASSIESDGLLIVIGALSRLPDAAAENLFSILPRRLGRGLSIEERRLSPGDNDLSSVLLATASADEAASWSESDINDIASYLTGGGHLWLDTADSGEIEPIMRRLAQVTDGDYGQLDASHQLTEGEQIQALTRGDKLLAVVTHLDWRRDWRHGESQDSRAPRFLVRSLNYFLSGNADAGIMIEPGEAEAGRLVQPYGGSIPETLAGGAPAGRVWDEFDPETADNWRMPSWSDPGRVSVISDGQGARALKLDLDAAVKGRAAVTRTLSPVENLESSRRLAVEAYYDGGGEASLSMVLTIDAGGGWKDYETPPVPLRSGWNRIEFDLSGSSFRSLSDGGDLGPAPSLGRVGRAGFFVYRASGTPAATLFRHIRLYEE